MPTLERMTKNRSHATVIALSGRSSTEFSIGHNVASRGEVEAVMAQIAALGSRHRISALRSGDEISLGPLAP